MKKKPAIITIGISGSGKTTFAKDFVEKNPGYKIICRDDIRWNLMEKDGKVPCWANWNWKKEKYVTEIKNQQILDYYNDPDVTGIIVADTNINEDFLRCLVEVLEFVGYTVTKKYFPIGWVDVCKRNAARQHGVNIDVLAKQFDQLNKLTIKQYVPDTNLPKAIIFDVDGTLAHHDGIRNPFEWDKVDQDTPDEEIIDMVKGYYHNKYEIIILSGRDACCKEKTIEWLLTYLPDVNFSLFMREKDDNRPDDIVKKEIFENFLMNNWNIKMVVDDRPKICRMWRSIGVKVLQIGNQNIEF